jgi:hypothetical protein
MPFMLKKITYHPFVIRLFHWEYWPAYIANIPVIVFWLYYALRARDAVFFSIVNPAIATGGMFGEEKHKIYQLIPTEHLPRTIHVSHDTPREHTIDMVAAADMTYPLVCKPDIGERGMHVKVVNSPDELLAHVQKMHGGVIIQEYISYPLELSVLCYRHPHNGERAVTSVCRKAFLTVTGDGRQSLSQLIDLQPRAILQKPVLASRMNLNDVPAQGESVVLELIGNHCRGTQFLNANAWITPELEDTMLAILERMDGVYYGRFDLRTASIDSLCRGQDFLIMEFNGVGSEPAHIYDPSYPVIRGYRDVLRHWGILYRIARAQKQLGLESPGLRQALKALRTYFQYKKQASIAFGS